MRNRIKRRLREAIRLRMDTIKPGWDLVFIARHPIRSADYHEIDAACARLLRRAQLFREEADRPPSVPAESASVLPVSTDPEPLDAHEQSVQS